MWITENQTPYPTREQFSTEPILFVLVESADHRTPLTGASPTVKLVKADGTDTTPAGTVSELGNGTYKFVPSANDLNVPGDMVLAVTATNADPLTIFYTILPDPGVNRLTWDFAHQTGEVGAPVGYLYGQQKSGAGGLANR